MSGLLEFLGIGLAIGTIGTLIGTGGGFILMPVLMLLFPERSPEMLTSVSLLVVFFNALSGSVAYHRQGRIDYRSGIIFSLAALPGAVAGATLTRMLPRHIFDPLFGCLLLLAAGYLMIRSERSDERSLKTSGKHFIRTLVDRSGVSHAIGYHPALAIAISFLVGCSASLFGIGGGILHVPAMVHLLHFPVHIAIATSQFILAITALGASVVHGVEGNVTIDPLTLLGLIGGAVIGAQIGARLSTKLHGRLIIRCLAVALILVGLRLLMKAAT
jgi:hypothetical protein